MRVIGLTGNIAAGKSTVSKELQKLGAIVIDADVIAREAVAPGSEGERAVRAAFGERYFDKNGLNRRRLGNLVFRDEAARNRLNAILHPIIVGAIKERLAALQRHLPKATCVIDAALLIETGLYKLCSEVWLVVASDDVRLRRIMERDRIPKEEARARMRAQTAQKLKLQKADRVLVNDDGREELIKQAREFFLAGERTVQHA